NASVLQQASGGSQGSQRMIWVNNVPDVTIRNLYVQTHLGRTKEAIVAIGDIDGLLIDNSYIKITANGSNAFGISINGAFSGAGSASSIPASFARMAGGFVTLRDNVIEPTVGSSIFNTYAPKRAILFEQSLGLIQGNQVAGGTVDLWTLSTNGTAATDPTERHLTIDGNWFFGRLQNQINPVGGTATALNITNNHYWTPGSSASPIALPLNPATLTSSESHLLRVAGNQSAPTLVEGNEFAGFTNQFRALWLQSRRDVTVRSNTFQPETNASEFTAITVGNRIVQTGTPPNPVAFGGLSIIDNNFMGSGAANTGKAILFVNDNDKGGLASGDSPIAATIGGTTAADANDFDSNIGWYIAIDDRSCTALNHNSGGTCNGTSAYSIGEGISYSGGANTASEKRPFIWDLSAPGNSFGGVPMASMNQAAFDAVWAKTFERHLSTLAATTLGQVDYAWVPLITVGTIDFSPLAFTYDGLAHPISATLQEDATATCVVTPASVTDAGDTQVSAVCTSSAYNVSGNAVVSVAKANGTVQLSQSAFTYSGSAQALMPSMVEEAGASCTATPASVTAAGSYTIAINCIGNNYDASGSVNVTVAKAIGTLSFGATGFTFDGSTHTTTALIAEEAVNTSACSLSYIPEAPLHVGSATAQAICDGTNYTASGSTSVTVDPASLVLGLTGTGTFVFDDADHLAGITVSGEVAGFPASTTLAYNGSATPPHDVGVYAIVGALDASVTDYTASNASGQIEITPATATVSISNLVQEFDGQPKPVNVTTNPVGLAVATTYDGASTPPIAIGNYAVTATITNPNYAGSTNATLEIIEAAAPDLGVTISVDRAFAQNGDVIIYTITVSNVGNRMINAATVSDTLPPELDDASATWSCIAGGGASCATSGNGNLTDNVVLPLGSNVTYLLAVDLLADTQGMNELISNVVSANASDDVNSTNDQASVDVQTVLFRDDFEIIAGEAQ
ncbi:MAG TPA: MBG domain-containing protein, partial [Dokdonella sp.]|nr:MBG domain-containing protein [Dokdonella sp.]